jgi:peptide/nickel transport system permease protein
MAAEARPRPRAALPRSLVIGAALCAVNLALAAAGPWLAPFGATEMGAGPPLAGASLAHPFGTDQLGRDVFSRTLHGGWLVLTLSLSGTALGFLAGGLLGLVSGLRGGWFDWAVMRACEALIAIPILVTALLVVALVDPQVVPPLPLIVAVIGFVYAPRIARIARTAAIEVATRDHVTAARLRGDSGLRRGCCWWNWRCGRPMRRCWWPRWASWASALPRPRRSGG